MGPGFRALGRKEEHADGRVCSVKRRPGEFNFEILDEKGLEPGCAAQLLGSTVYQQNIYAGGREH